MKAWQRALTDSLWLGQIAAAATALVTAACGHVENGNAIAPINAISHIAFGDDAFTRAAASAPHTVTGLVLNDAASAAWAALYELVFVEAADAGDKVIALLGGVAVAGLAYSTDYYLVPKRFTPGFEQHLSGRSLCLIYTVLALCLGAGGLRRYP